MWLSRFLVDLAGEFALEVVAIFLFLEMLHQQ